MKQITSSELNKKLSELSRRGTARLTISVRDIEDTEHKFSLSFTSKIQTHEVVGFHGERIPNAPKNITISGNNLLELIDTALDS